MANREQIIACTREVIIKNPSWGRRTIGKYLREIFGAGLRESTIAHIRREMNIPPPIAGRKNINIKTISRQRAICPNCGYIGTLSDIGIICPKCSLYILDGFECVIVSR